MDTTSKILKRQTFEVRVMHEYGFFSFYKIDAFEKTEASKKAIKQFRDDFCGGNTQNKCETYCFDPRSV